MSSIVLAVGNGKTLFGGSGVAPDADLVRFVDPESPIINAFDLCALRGDGIFEATTVWRGFPVSLENHLKRLANSARLVDMPEPNIPALTRAVQLVIDQYDDPEPGPMLRIIVSRGLDPDTGVGKAADRTPTVYIFLDAKGTLHSLEPITMASMTRGYPSDITARAPWLLNGAKTHRTAPPPRAPGSPPAVASATRFCSRRTATRWNARIRRLWHAMAIRSSRPTRASVF